MNAHMGFLADANLNSLNSFFTRESVFTFSGMVAVIFVICNALQRAFNFNPRWLGLVIGVGLCCVGASRLPQADIWDYILAVVNGCLVFLAATAGTQAAGAATGSGGGGGGPGVAGPGGPAVQGGPAVRGNAPVKRGFLTPWF